MKSSTQSGFTHLIVVVFGVLVLGAVGFAGWRVYDANQSSDSVVESAQTAPAAQTDQAAVQAVESELDAAAVEQDLDSSALDTDLNDLY